MKKISILSTSAIVFAIACIVFIKLDQRIVASALGMAAYFLALFVVKKESAKWQIVVFISIAAIFGYALSADGLFYMVVCTLLLAFLGVVRLLFFKQLFHTGSPWIEPVLFIVALVYYIIGNMHSDSGWIGWTFAGAPMFMGFFMTFGHIMDVKEFEKRTGLPFFAEVGKDAPSFSLPDQDGNVVNLSDYKGKRHVLLIFVRGDWCPTCHIMLRTYEKYKNKFQEKNIMIIAIGPDPVGVNREMVINLGLDYKILSDEKQEAAKKYVMQPQDNNPMTKYAEGIPLPASFLVDINGKVVYTSNPHKAGEMLSPDKIFDVVATLR